MAKDMCICKYFACAGCMPVHAPNAFGAYTHPVRIPAAGGGVGAVVGLGEGKNVGVPVVGAAVAVTATQIGLPTACTTRILL
jgi:hypothetical protein